MWMLFLVYIKENKSAKRKLKNYLTEMEYSIKPKRLG